MPYESMSELVDRLAAALAENQRLWDENARLRAELEAAKGDIPRKCVTCQLRKGWETCGEAKFISDGEECLSWQWRGATENQRLRDENARLRKALGREDDL